MFAMSKRDRLIRYCDFYLRLITDYARFQSRECRASSFKNTSL